MYVGSVLCAARSGPPAGDVGHQQPHAVRTGPASSPCSGSSMLLPTDLEVALPNWPNCQRASMLYSHGIGCPHRARPQPISQSVGLLSSGSRLAKVALRFSHSLYSRGRRDHPAAASEDARRRRPTGRSPVTDADYLNTPRTGDVSAPTQNPSTEPVAEPEQESRRLESTGASRGRPPAHR